MGLLFPEHPKAQPGGGFLEKPGIVHWILTVNQITH